MKSFDPKELEKLYKRTDEAKKGEGGQVTIVGGSDLFHGAPLLALKTASRVVDMVYFASPEPSIEEVAAKLKAQLGSFIWVPWEEADDYIKKSDAVLIGPGMKRWHREKLKVKSEKLKVFDEAGRQTAETTKELLARFPNKQWVIDGGSLQVMETSWIPEGAVLTPNRKEYEMLFGGTDAFEAAKRHSCIIVQKGPETIVCSPQECVSVSNGNPGLTKGGTGDVVAGLTVALLSKNDSFLAATAASWIVKKAADELFRKVGEVYNADDLAEEVPKILGQYLK